MLTLRLKNVSPDVVLAPLDEAFVRDRINADPDSFIEAGPTGATIAMFPLAVESEWSIVGQSFRELQPGEAFEFIVVSAPDAAGKLTYRCAGGSVYGPTSITRTTSACDFSLRP